MISNYLLFMLADRVFGTPLSRAKEIFAWKRPRPVPLAYSYVDGLIDYRGVVFPVINLDQQLGLQRTPGTTAPLSEAASPLRAKSIVLLEIKNRHFGIVVDSVLKMSPLDEGTGVQQRIEGLNAKFLRTVVKTEDFDVIILDLEGLFHAV